MRQIATDSRTDKVRPNEVNEYISLMQTVEILSCGSCSGIVRGVKKPILEAIDEHHQELSFRRI